MSNLQPLNQFAQAPVVGMQDLGMAPNTVSAIVDSTSAGGLVPGQVVKRVATTGGGPPHVVEIAAATDQAWGIILYSVKDAVFNALQLVEVALLNGGGCVYVAASAAITADASVSASAVTVGAPTVATQSASNVVLGRAYDGFAAAASVGRLLLLPPVTSTI